MLARAGRVIKETFGLGAQSLHGRVRYVSWVLITLLTFVLSGGQVFTRLRVLAEGLFHLDNAIRATALTAFRPRDLVPVTLVEIDDATVKRWPMVDVTPRKELARLLQVVSSAKPAAIVVDLDLSDPASDRPETAQSEREFRDFLQAYRETAPLILVRRVILSADDLLHVTQNALVKALEAEPNPHVSWTHALYITDADGTVRRWPETVHACAGASEFAMLPAVPISVLADGQWTDPVFPRPAYAPEAATSCGLVDPTRLSHIIMFGERLTGATARVSDGSVMRLSAWQLTDDDIQRDDLALFRQRVVIVGGTHERANDSWRTPIGIVPGVELIANTVRFSAGQLKYGADTLSGVREGLWAMGLFLCFACLSYFLRGMIAGFMALLLTVAVVWVNLSLRGFFPILDATETSLLLFVQFRIFEELFSLIHKVRDQRWRASLAPRFSEEAIRERHRKH